MSVQFPFLENKLQNRSNKQTSLPEFRPQKREMPGANQMQGLLSGGSRKVSRGLNELFGQSVGSQRGSPFSLGNSFFNSGQSGIFGSGLGSRFGQSSPGGGSTSPLAGMFGNFNARDAITSLQEKQAAEAAQNQQGISTGQVTNGPGQTGEWASMINAAAEHHGMPADVIMSIMMIETQGVNTKGPMTSEGTPAFGLMQVMPNWFAERTTAYGGTGSAEDLMDPYMNIMVGSEILKEHYDRAMRERPGISEEQAWNIAAGAYFSGWHGQSTDTDVLGTSTTEYIDMFNQHLQTIRQANPQQSSVNLPGAQEGTVSTIFGGQPYTITQGYGHTSFSQSSGWYGEIGHPGIDVGVPQGTQMYAPISGTVIHAGLNGGYGGTVTIQTEWGTLMLTHLSGIDVQVGQQIQTGMGIGLSGGAEGTWGAGTSTGPHVHIEARDHNGNPFDPTGVLQF